MGSSQGRDSRKIDEERSSHLQQLNATVDRVTIDGLGRTKDDFVIGAVKDLFKATNFEEMLKQSHAAKNKLERLGCFQNVSIHVDTSTGPKATPDYGYHVTFTVRELNKIYGGFHSMMGTNNEAHIVVFTKAPNILGRGEKIQASYSYGSKKSQNLDITVEKPLLTEFNASIAGSVFSHTQQWTMSGYDLGEHGLKVDFSFFTLKNLKHSIQWEAMMREINVGNRFTSFDIRENAGSTLKSSLKHIFTYDTRRSLLFPSSGILAKLTSEIAGLGGNIGFLKNDALLQLDIPLIPDIVLQGSLSGGFMVPVDSTNKDIMVCDHFFLGGPVTFRGFDVRGAGPSSDGNFIGAKMYWCAGLSVFTPLPFRPDVGGLGKYFRTHFFANIGNIGNFNLTADGASSLLHQARLAFGMGLALKLGQLVRLEVNYCFPTWTQEGDRANHGVQIGLGTSF